MSKFKEKTKDLWVFKKTRCPSGNDVFHSVQLQFLLASANVSDTQWLAKDEANTGDGGWVNGLYLVDRRMGYVSDDHEQLMRYTTKYLAI